MANYPTVPEKYKGKDTMKMSRAEYEKMLQELGINKKGVKPIEYPGEEPDTAPVTKAHGGAITKKKKMAAGGLLVIPVKMKKAIPEKYAGASKAKKKKKVK